MYMRSIPYLGKNRQDLIFNFGNHHIERFFDTATGCLLVYSKKTIRKINELML